MTDEVADAGRVLKDLRTTRRRRRVAELDRFEALYRAYITAIVSSVVVVLLVGVIGDGKVDAATLANVERRGPAAVGLVVALCWAIGLRSGGRGGPLVVEAADIRHVLLAPVDRSLVMRGPAVRQLRFGALVGAATGAVAGLLAHQRLPGSTLGWLGAGAAAGLVTVVGALGLAIVVSGLRLGRVVGGLLALAVLGWSVADLVANVKTSPATLVGEIAMWPLRFRASAVGGVVVVVVFLVAGMALVGRGSLEASERRAGLVGQIRFAATLQDLRTVVVLRRQLAQEQPRQRPWIRLPRSIPVALLSAPVPFKNRRLPVWRRGWHGILRFPAMRMLRLVALGALAGVCMVGVWHGTTALFLVAALALYLVGLDTSEPVAQEVDHPDRQDQFALPAGLLHLRQLAAPAAVSILVGILAVAAAVVASGGATLALEIGAVVVVPASLAGLGGAAMTVINGPPPPLSPQGMLPPEVAGIKVVLRLFLPIVVAVAGVLPVVAARQSARSTAANGMHPVQVALATTIPVVILLALVFAWVRYGPEIRPWWEKQMEFSREARRPGAVPPGARA